MMKFILVAILGSSALGLGKVGVWLTGGFMVFLYLLFMPRTLLLVDYLYLSEYLGMDMFSFSLILLSMWVSVLMLFSSNLVYLDKFYLIFVLLIYALMLILILTFLVNNLLGFYFFFESSLIPTLLIIMGWGYQPERLQAGVYFLFYTLGASLPLLLFIILAYYCSGGVSYDVMLNISYFHFGLLFFAIMAFMVKMPMFFTHLWLPKAHVEAPVSGSMVLAGVLLKLGGYGLYRIFFLVGGGVSKFGGYYFGLSVMGMVYVGYICCRMVDMKALVAYSSVAHMGMVISGVVSYYFWGFGGALMMMVAHGVCSSGLFCAVNIYYERSGSRGFYMNKGLVSVLPVFTLMFFMLCGANMAAPPTINLLSEVFLMGSMMKFNFLMILAFPVGSYLGALFTLFLFSFSQHGKFHAGVGGYWVSLFREYYLMVFHLGPLNLIIFKPEFFMLLV